MKLMPKKALIFGITGQDGAYLARSLLQKGYEVFGTSRHAKLKLDWRLHFLAVDDKVKVFSVDPTDFKEVLNIIETTSPDEIYHLSGQSSVAVSYDQPEETKKSIVNSTENILKAIAAINKNIKLFLACSSECFGPIEDKATELTHFRPQNPYAKAKSDAYDLVRSYREKQGLFACSGILFNHESPLRGENYVTRKITRAVADIKLGRGKRLVLGNLEIQRDWGYAPEYVEAMQLMLQNKIPTDYVIASGRSHSIRDFCEIAFSHVSLNYEEHVTSDPKFIRPNDVLYSGANPDKIYRELGWRSERSFESLVSLMLDFERQNEI